MQKAALSLAVGLYTIPYVLRSIRNSSSSEVPSGVNREGKSKLALCTGSASGIGRATTLQLLAEGWTVVAADINSEGLKNLREQLSADTAKRLFTHVVDISDNTSRAQLVSAVRELVDSKQVSGLDAVISAAGIIDAQPVATLSEERFSQIFEVNALGAIKLINALCPLLVEGEGGRVTVVSSMSGRYSWPWAGAYPATKHALEGYCKTLRLEAKANRLPLKVSLIQPGAVATQLAMSLPNKQLEWAKANPGTWTPGLKEAAGRTQSLMKRGFKIEWVAVTPAKVVAKIMHSVSAKQPHENYVIGSLPMLMIFYLALWLPTPFADMLLLSL